MSGLIGREDGVWVVRRGKYASKTLREVAQDDPAYFKWIYSGVDDLSKEQAQAIEEIAEQEGIDL